MNRLLLRLARTVGFALLVGYVVYRHKAVLELHPAILAMVIIFGFLSIKGFILMSRSMKLKRGQAVLRSETAPAFGMLPCEDETEITNSSFFGCAYFSREHVGSIRNTMKVDSADHTDFVFDVYSQAGKYSPQTYVNTIIAFKMRDRSYVPFRLVPVFSADGAVSQPFNHYFVDTLQIEKASGHFTEEVVSFLDARCGWEVVGFRKWLVAWKPRAPFEGKNADFLSHLDEARRIFQLFAKTAFFKKGR